MKYVTLILLSATFGLLSPVTFASPAFEVPLPETITFYQDIYEYKYAKGRMRALFTLQTEEIAGNAGNGVCYWQKPESTEDAQTPKTQPNERTTWQLNPEKAAEFFLKEIIPKVEREAENVRIFKNAEGAIMFEGAGNYGKKLDVNKAIALLETALNNGVSRVELPLIKTPPFVTVDDAELKNAGITELVSVGESNFTGSSWARMKNIEVGASKFTGYLIPQGEIASFNTQLGNVTDDEGYVPELVIQGPKLEKELGGGLCQVSSTAFRAALLAGLPIVERYAHSFAVSYYEPWGTDATIYPGHKDLRFQNDTNGAILVQTTMNRDTKTLRFHFYGTKDSRKVKLFGPSNSSMVATKGFNTQWFRIVEPNSSETGPGKSVAEKLVYGFFSRYQPSTKWAVQKPAPAPAKEPEIVPADAPTEPVPVPPAPNTAAIPVNAAGTEANI